MFGCAFVCFLPDRSHLRSGLSMQMVRLLTTARWGARLYSLVLHEKEKSFVDIETAISHFDNEQASKSGNTQKKPSK